uniref:Putative secreted protein n=1 Tax=Rhipicephalus microplus TaxID=6941 RepID=A0A6G5A2I4_RHIMP
MSSLLVLSGLLILHAMPVFERPAVAAFCEASAYSAADVAISKRTLRRCRSSRECWAHAILKCYGSTSPCRIQ